VPVQQPEVEPLALRESVVALERAFPNRVRAYYLEGSWADQTALPTSDVDLVVVFKEHFLDREQARARKVQAAFAQTSAVEFDATLVDEAALAQGAPPNLHLGAVLIHGEDVRGDIGLVPIGAWARDRMHNSYWRIITLFGRPIPVQLPVGYPDTQGFVPWLRLPADTSTRRLHGARHPRSRPVHGLGGHRAGGPARWPVRRS
jgi:Nucleotidyltransferase domain